jgi:hypothetical protein
VDHHTHPHKVGDTVHVAKNGGMSSATVTRVCVGSAGSDVKYTVAAGATSTTQKSGRACAIGSAGLCIPVIRVLHPRYKDAPIVWSEGLYQRYNTVELLRYGTRRYGNSKKLLVQVLPNEHV